MTLIVFDVNRVGHLSVSKVWYKHEDVSAAVSVIPPSQRIKSQIVFLYKSNDRHNHLNMSQVFLKCSAFGERPTLVLSSGAYRAAAKKIISTTATPGCKLESAPPRALLPRALKQKWRPKKRKVLLYQSMDSTGHPYVPS